MKESKFLGEKLFQCPCGASFWGQEKDFEFHAESLCPVVERAIKILRKKNKN